MFHNFNDLRASLLACVWIPKPDSDHCPRMLHMYKPPSQIYLNQLYDLSFWLEEICHFIIWYFARDKNVWEFVLALCACPINPFLVKVSLYYFSPNYTIHFGQNIISYTRYWSHCSQKTYWHILLCLLG